MQNFLEKAAKAYYEGNPIISDAEFDALAEKAGYNDVGYRSDFRFSHLYPMYSLQKVYEGDEYPWPVDSEVVVTSKLDGAAVSLRYSEGELVLALTRGDGKKGLDITEKMKLLVPTTIDYKGEVQITGEVVCPSIVQNARNVASGSLNLKSLEEFHSRPLSFIAYDVFPKVHNYWTDELKALNSFGFHTVLDKNWDEYPHDGKVFRINNVGMFEQLGYTAHHPRGAFALKEVKAGVSTKLLDVVWQVGKSGVVSPVAILEPVVVGEAVVSRATLHNMKYINELDLEIGCMVEVIRSGEIIPRVLRRL